MPLTKVPKLNQVVDKKWHCHDPVASVRALHGVHTWNGERLDYESALDGLQYVSGYALAFVKTVVTVVAEHELVVVVLVPWIRLLKMMNRKRTSVLQSAQCARIISFNKEQVITRHG